MPHPQVRTSFYPLQVAYRLLLGTDAVSLAALWTSLKVERKPDAFLSTLDHHDQPLDQILDSEKHFLVPAQA